MQAYNQDEDRTYQNMVRSCAEACGVDAEAVQKIVPASEDQRHFMERHRANGSYVMQTVLHIQGNPTKPFLVGILHNVGSKNEVLRTRLVKYRGLVFQAILNDIVQLRGSRADIRVFLARDSALRMGYGNPLIRCTFVQGPQASYIVLTSKSLLIGSTTRFELTL